MSLSINRKLQMGHSDGNDGSNQKVGIYGSMGTRSFAFAVFTCAAPHRTYEDGVWVNLC